jgi:hypothetical protein
MSGSGRLADLFGFSSPLREASALLPSDAGLDAGWPGVLANGLWGGYLTATVDPANARIRVDLDWPNIRYAVVERVHADGSAYQVRGGDPATVCTLWARYDYEAPFDVPVYYRATSIDRTEAVAVSDPVTLSSQGRHWLKSVTNPALNMAVYVQDRGDAEQDPQAGKVSPPERPDPIFVYQVRRAEAGRIALYAADHAIEAAIRAILAAGGPLLFQRPAVAGGESMYLMVGKSGYRPPIRLTVDLQKFIELPYESITRPDGAAHGGLRNTYEAMSDAYQTYSQQAAGATSYLEQSMMTF